VRRRALPLILPLVLLPAACGGSESVERTGSPPASGPMQQTSDAPPPRAPTRREFVTKARAICTEAWETVPAGLRDASPQEQLEAGMDTWSDVVGRLRRLEPPAGEKARVGRMLRHFENAIRAARGFSRAEDEGALALFAGLIDQGQKGATIARSYGLDHCSLVPPMPSEKELAESDAFQKAMEHFTGELLDPNRATLTQP
jgi:hypothetical protein